jgi:SAM-dependent methyltransferase
VLDYGCGVGRLMLPLSRQLGGHWYGCDISPDMIAELSRQVDDYYPHIAGVAVTDGSGIPEDFVEADSIDQIYSVITFQHIASHTVVLSILRSFQKVLKPEGIITIQVKKFRDGLRPWNYVPPENGQPDPVGYKALPEHLHPEEGCAYTQDQLNNVLKQCGLQATAMWETNPIDDHGRWLWVHATK